MSRSTVAFYARVSSDAQARDHTIESQIAALKERIAADGHALEPEHAYVDEGHSGTHLQRPALEKLRDAIATGCVDCVFVHAPDRLARSYVNQVLLMEEFRRAGVEVVFLNHAIGKTAEDELLLQIQAVIAEYERAKLLERVRRGRRHAARSGLVSALTAAPYGYRYVRRDQGDGVARFEVVEDEARVVRLIFAWVGLDRLSLRAACRRLQQMGCRTRRGLAHWSVATIYGMLENPAYIGRAVLGRTRVLLADLQLRSNRRNARPVPSATRRIRDVREDRIEIAVPALVDPAVFEAAQMQLIENRKRKREQRQGPRWLLQGLMVCRSCGYAYCGRRFGFIPTGRSKGARHYYRCIGTEEHRLHGAPKCSNPTVHGGKLDQVVWDQVRALLENPNRVAHEYQRRIGQAQDGAAPSEQVVRLDRQMTTLRRSVDRLIDSYTGGLIDKTEFEPRVTGLKQRMSELDQQRQTALDTANADRELSLVINRLEDFSTKVAQGLDQLDWIGKRTIIHTLVRKIEIGHGGIEVVFRAPSTPDLTDRGPRPPELAPHCSSVCKRPDGPPYERTSWRPACG
jgi:site-specific DNA recombinase